MDKLETFGEFWDFFQVAMTTLTGDFMKYSFVSKDMNRIRGTWHQCFAHDCIKALDVIDKYECGIMDRVKSWFNSLCIKHELEPKAIGRMMHTEGQCHRNYILLL